MRLLRPLNLFALKKSAGGSLQYLQQCQCQKYSTGYDDDDDKKHIGREHPASRTIRVLKGDMRRLKNNFKNFFNIPIDETEEMKKDKEIFSDRYDQWQDHCDVVVIGGGIIGTSIAYWLKQRVPKGLHIVVIEKDPTYSKSSTTLSCGGLRQQFSLSENIRMSQFGAKFLRAASKKLHVEGHDPPDVKFTPQGYLLLAHESGAEQMLQNHELQKELRVKNILLTGKQLKERYPWLNTEDIALGCLGMQDEGWFSPSSLLDALKKKSIELDTKFVEGEAIGFERKDQPDVFMEGVEQNTFESLRKVVVRTPNGEKKTVEFGIAVLACGAESGHIAELAGLGVNAGLRSVPLPVESRKRHIYSVYCPGAPNLDLPILVDPTGAYIRRAGLGGNYICGRCPPDCHSEPSSRDFEVDSEFFNKHVLPQLAHRVPKLQALQVNNSWAGHTDYNYFDQNAVLGPHPYYSNLYVATGFGGNAVQHAPAVGRAVMEMILDSSFRTIDLSIFGFDRLLLGNKVQEKNII